MLVCDHGYTLKKTCSCGKTRTPHPPKYRERFVEYARRGRK